MGNQIQIDAFEVQLGAGLLLQLRSNEQKRITVLADAGVHASGYRPDHVLGKLDDCFREFPGNGDIERRLDLIIGTHYDKDHLAGLVPIIEDETLEIGEAWMPPVADDSKRHDTNSPPSDEDFLPIRFAMEDGEARLLDYLGAKARTCEEVLAFEKQLREASEQIANETGPVLFKTALVEHRLTSERASIAEYSAYFEHQFENASEIAEVAKEHADEVVGQPLSPAHIVEELERAPYYFNRARFRAGIAGALSDLLEDAGGDAREHALRFAEIRRAAAADAITATSLRAVVKALKQRRIPIKCYVIKDGEPRRFVWNATKRRFIPSQRRASAGPELRLLAPSESLVRKHWDRLPVGDYLAFLAVKRLPVKHVTPSNQLSYVLRVDAAQQHLLISGDAGCVDFKQADSTFYPKLLAEMAPLHFIQVAHHAGQNAHFYNVLLESKYPEQTEESFLLLSHATHDRSRPSDIFRRFVEEARKDGDDFKLLFTSEPTAAKVADFDELICPVVGGQPDDRGDVRLVFNGQHWAVTKHLVKV